MHLGELKPPEDSRKKRKRIGRGVGSGWGKTAGRGNKGLKSRSGGKVRHGFEGGQMPIHRRLPKRGFANIFRKEYAIINIKDLEKFRSYGDIVDEAVLLKNGLVKGKYYGIKLLGNGNIDFPITIKVHKISDSAKNKVEQAGGKIEVL